MSNFKGKGSRPRPYNVDKFNENFDKIFAKKISDDEINEVGRERGLHPDDDREEIINFIKGE
jgi:oxalate decarboxylase/phosphoglucose isomerase-like protein (cupin superfamily)|tara:strand:- start:58 stop:243 length:186 start_codon:yes stop_codon:yes gene_type:complete